MKKSKTTIELYPKELNSKNWAFYAIKELCKLNDNIWFLDDSENNKVPLDKIGERLEKGHTIQIRFDKLGYELDRRRLEESKKRDAEYAERWKTATISSIEDKINKIENEANKLDYFSTISGYTKRLQNLSKQIQFSTQELKENFALKPWQRAAGAAAMGLALAGGTVGGYKAGKTAGNIESNERWQKTMSISNNEINNAIFMNLYETKFDTGADVDRYLRDHKTELDILVDILQICFENIEDRRDAIKLLYTIKRGSSLQIPGILRRAYQKHIISVKQYSNSIKAYSDIFDK